MKHHPIAIPLTIPVQFPASRRRALHVLHQRAIGESHHEIAMEMGVAGHLNGSCTGSYLSALKRLVGLRGATNAHLVAHYVLGLDTLPTEIAVVARDLRLYGDRRWQQALELLANGYDSTQAGRELGVTRQTISAWLWYLSDDLGHDAQLPRELLVSAWVANWAREQRQGVASRSPT